MLFNYLPSTLGICGHGIEIFKPALALYAILLHVTSSSAYKNLLLLKNS
jgi:hypothetical protein